MSTQSGLAEGPLFSLILQRRLLIGIPESRSGTEDCTLHPGENRAGRKVCERLLLVISPHLNVRLLASSWATRPAWGTVRAGEALPQLSRRAGLHHPLGACPADAPKVHTGRSHLTGVREADLGREEEKAWHRGGAVCFLIKKS